MVDLLGRGFLRPGCSRANVREQAEAFYFARTWAGNRERMGQYFRFTRLHAPPFVPHLEIAADERHERGTLSTCTTR